MSDHSAPTSWPAPHEFGAPFHLTALASSGYRGLHEYLPLGLTQEDVSNEWNLCTMEQGSIGPGSIAIHAAHLCPAILIGI